LSLPIQKSTAKLWRCRFRIGSQLCRCRIRNRQPKIVSLPIHKSAVMVESFRLYFFFFVFTFQVHQSSRRTWDINNNKLYEFYYLLHFDLWTSYLARIIFLQGCGNLFLEFSSSKRIFNGLQLNFQVARI
jgi:hypothetical protein